MKKLEIYNIGIFVPEQCIWPSDIMPFCNASVDLPSFHFVIPIFERFENKENGVKITIL